MKRITMLLTNEFNPDPRVYKEAVYLISRGAKVTILCWNRDPSLGHPDRELIDGIEVVRFPIPSVAGSGMKQVPAFFSYIRACRKYLKEHPCDYVHCHDIDGAITGFLARRGTPMVFDMHEDYEDLARGRKWMRNIWRSFTIFLIQRSIAAIYVGECYLAEPYRCIRHKLVQLKNFPDSDILQPLPKTPSEVFRIGYHGAVRGQIAEFTTLFEAVRDMKDVRVDVHGGGPSLAKLKELEKEYNNVHVHGPFNGITELPGLYADADIVFAGYSPDSLIVKFAQAVKFFECILTSTPMILTEAYTAMSSEIREYGYGLACDTRDVEAVRAAVLKLKNDRDFREACAENERKRAHLYDWKEAVRVLDEIYDL